MKSLPVPVAVRVQRVDIVYTKASRGAPAASARNRLPRAFLLHQRTQTEPAGFEFEHLNLYEWRGFDATMASSGAGPAPPRQHGSLLLQLDAGGLRLGLGWIAELGEPFRRQAPAALRLQPRQTARLLINGRYTSYSGQHYTESIYNVAYESMAGRDVFVQAEPDLVFDLRADLF